MNVIFLDIDGVLNCLETAKRDGGYGIAKDLHARLVALRAATKASIVVSSTWRIGERWRERLEKAGLDMQYVIGKTPRMPRPVGTSFEYCERGKEIQAWLDKHPSTKRYAILDDDSDMLPSQMHSFFKTSQQKGLTEEIVAAVTAHLNT